MAIVALHSASTGLRALSTSLDVIANNLANANTDGFKASRVNFQDLLYIERAQPGVENAAGDQRPTGLYVGLGVKVSGTQTDFRPGPAHATARELDIMVDGEGFFVVQVEDEVGESGQAFTRAGNFILNSEGEIVLATDQGRRLMPNVQIPPDATQIEILADGTILVGIAGQAEPEVLDTIQLATFINPAGLKPIGENLYVQTAASGEPAIGEPLEGGRGALRQGFLEGSNVDPVVELVNLIRTQRAFELNSQSIQAADEALQTVSRMRRF
jgi:flagellar basal-body rod protein FlgG